MSIPEIKSGSVLRLNGSINVDFGSLKVTYKPPKGTRFVVLLLGDEPKGNEMTIDVDEFLRLAGWTFADSGEHSS
jgi:hypothetical protein